MRTIYLDNAATSYPKPQCVYDAVNDSLHKCGGNPGRGSHMLARNSADEVFICRTEAADLFSCEPENVIFTQNTTSAINIALKCKLRRGNHVIIGSAEHNSVARPVFEAARRGVASYSIFDSGTGTGGIIESIKSLINNNTAIIMCAHVSNVCSLTMPLYEIGQLCRERGLFFIVDAAQSAGCHNIDMDEMNINALCVPGHKGLFGIMGCGMLILRSADGTNSVVEGGSGINSLEPYMPDVLPERFEAGTLPLPAIAGLRAGINYINSRGIFEIYKYECGLCNEFIGRINETGYVKLYMNRDGVCGSSVLFNINNISSEKATAVLDRDYGIAVRGGFQCAPMAHKLLCTPQHGAVRASFGVFNTLKDVKTASDAVADIAKRALKGQFV